MHTCPLCNIILRTAKGVHTHLEIRHTIYRGYMPASCLVCRRQFLTSGNLYMHFARRDRQPTVCKPVLTLSQKINIFLSKEIPFT